MKANRSSINYNKSEYIIVTKKKSKPKLNIKIDNNPINQNTCIQYDTKYLGALIDDALNWKP